MTATLALASKDLRLLARDRASLFFAFAFPVLYAVFFGMIFQGVGTEIGGRMDVLVVDEDRTDASRALINEMNATRELRAHEQPRAEAVDLVRRGKHVAYIIIPAGFAHAEANRFSGQLPRLEVGADPSRGAEAGMLRGVLFQIMGRRLQHTFANPAAMRAQIAKTRAALAGDAEADPAAAVLIPFFHALDVFLARLEAQQAEDNDPNAAGAAAGAAFRGFEPAEIVAVETRLQRAGPPNAYVISFPQAIVWGLMGCSAGFGIGLVVERQHGTLTRLRLAPVSLASILGGKALACLIANATVAVALLGVMALFFRVRPERVDLVVLAIACAAICFTGLMMLLAALGRTEQAAGGIGWAVLTVMAMLGGGMVPVFFMPAWMQKLSNISPVKWAIVAFEGPLWRQYSFAEMLTPCGVLLAIGAVSFAIGVGVFARRLTR